mgnify:FL=1
MEVEEADMAVMAKDAIHALDKVRELTVKLLMLRTLLVDVQDRTLLVHSCKACSVALVAAETMLREEKVNGAVVRSGERRKPGLSHPHKRLKLDPQVTSSSPTSRSATTTPGLGNHGPR